MENILLRYFVMLYQFTQTDINKDVGLLANLARDVKLCSDVRVSHLLYKGLSLRHDMTPVHLKRIGNEGKVLLPSNFVTHVKVPCNCHTQ